MGESVQQNLQRRQLLRRTIECLASALEGEAREEFLANAEQIMNRSNPPASVASKRKSFKIV